MTDGRRVLGRRALNRALLGRQLLLERVGRPVPEVIEHLVALQAQVPRDPYVALWSRISGFDPADLEELILTRRAVRLPLLRGTIHLVTAGDCVRLRPAVQDVLVRQLYHGSPFGRGLAGVDREALVAAGRAALADGPRTLADVRRTLGPQWPDHTAGDLAAGVHHLLPLVQVPPRGLWHRSGQVRWAAADTYLGRPLDGDPAPDAAVLRYLAAYGPATAMDVRAWSGLAGVREIVDRLRPQLRTFRDERGRELFDVPGAPLPDEATPAPPRFLPEYDNALLAHADRSRIVADPAVAALYERPGVQAGVLVDGFLAATWTMAREGVRPRLVVASLRPLPVRPRRAVEAEGRRLLALVSGADADPGDVEFVVHSG